MNLTCTEANLAIQCTTATGEVGDFLFVPGSKPRQAVSPVFPHLSLLYEWCKAHDWEFIPHSNHPVGTYRRHT